MALKNYCTFEGMICFFISPGQSKSPNRFARGGRLAKALSGLVFVLFGGCIAMEGHSGRWTCNDNSDCFSSEACRFHEETGRRVCLHRDKPYCKTDIGCGTGRCENGFCRPSECDLFDEQVCGAYACDVKEALCRKECQSYGHCKQGFRCSGGACVLNFCTDEGQCEGYACNNGKCTGYCSDQDPCTTGYHCEKGQCQAGEGGAAGAAGAAGTAGAGGGPQVLPAQPCDPVENTGCSGSATPKCTINSELVTACGPQGTSLSDYPCAASELGQDKCAPGLICTGYGVESYNTKNQSGKQCRYLCRTHDDCPAGFCAEFSKDGIGVCVFGCTPFSEFCGIENNGTCTGLFKVNNSPTSEIGIGCRAVGTSPENAVCVEDAECQAGLICIEDISGQKRCKAICDYNHPCPDGTCKGSDGKECPFLDVCLCP